MRERAAILLALLPLVGTAGGCSLWLGVAPPERIDPGSYPECGVPISAIVVDTVTGLTTGALAFAAAQDGSEAAGAAIGLASASLLASAVRGAFLRHDCQEARTKARRFLELDPLRTDTARPLPVAPPPAPAAPSVP